MHLDLSDRVPAFQEVERLFPQFPSRTIPELAICRYPNGGRYDAVGLTIKHPGLGNRRTRRSGGHFGGGMPGGMGEGVRLTLDASAALEILLRTKRGQAAEELLGKADLYAPELLDVEVGATLRCAVRTGRLEVARAEQALALLREPPLERLSHAELLIPAFALRDNLKVYDAIYVVTAGVVQATLLTADGPLARAPGLGIQVWNLQG